MNLLQRPQRRDDGLEPFDDDIKRVSIEQNADVCSGLFLVGVLSAVLAHGLVSFFGVVLLDVGVLIG